MELSSFAFDVIKNLLMLVIRESVNYDVQKFFEKRRIESRIEDAIAEGVEPLLPFLEQEHISEDKQRRLIQTCVDELSPLAKKPEKLFQGSLNGQKIFEDLYLDRELPQVIIEDDVKDIYSLLCPRVATLLCKIPAAVKDWENEAWSESYRRLDEIIQEVRKVFNAVDELSTSPQKQHDEILSIARKTVSQKIRLELDLTGLRADEPIVGKIDDFFVHPNLLRVYTNNDDNTVHTSIDTAEKSTLQITTSTTPTIIWGPAGSGKSTFTKWFQREVLTPKWSGLCIRVEIRGLSNSELPSLHDLVRNNVSKHLAEELTTQRITHWLESKKIIVIVDGFDEVPPLRRDNVIEWIQGLKSVIRKCPLIVTSRPLTTDHLKKLSYLGWQNWSIEPFDEPRIIEYIERWYTHTPLSLDESYQFDATTLAQNWRSDSTIEPLTENPLLLSTLLMVNHLDGSLPSGRSELYRRYVEGMLGLWDTRRQVSATDTILSLEEKRQIIRGLALKLFFEDKEQLDEDLILEWLESFLQHKNIQSTATEVLDVLRERSGLIIGPGIYSFAHKSIAEYLVAETVLQGDQNDTDGNRVDRLRLLKNQHNDRWNTVTFLWAGLVPIGDLEIFIEMCLEDANLELSLGLLNDQYERFSSNIRNSLFQKIITYSFDKNQNNFRLMGWSGPQEDRESRNNGVPIFELRSISQNINITNLVEKFEFDEVINIFDLTDIDEEWKDIIWITHIANSNRVDLWKTHFPSRLLGEELKWLYQIILSKLMIDLKSNNLSTTENLMNIYLKRFPALNEIIQYIFLSAFLILILRSEDFLNMHLSGSLKELEPKLNISNQPLITHVLTKALDFGARSEINPIWLLGTSKWTIDYLVIHDAFDLLETFITNAHKLMIDDLLIDKQILEKSIVFVEKLKKERELLRK